jgi:hypothetical protein
MEFREYLEIVDMFEKEAKIEVNKNGIGPYNKNDILKIIDNVLITMEAEVARMNYPRGV